jgi:transposase
MSRDAKVNWQGDAGFELIEMIKSGKTQRDVVNFLYSKYGVSYSAARISQLVKSFKLEGRL